MPGGDTKVNQQEVRLQQQAVRDLANSGGLPFVLVYPTLALFVGFASDLWRFQPTMMYLMVAATTLLGVLRQVLGQRLRLASPPQLSARRFMYSGAVLSLATCWSGYAAWITLVYRHSWNGLIAIVATLGLVAASTFNLTAYLPLLLGYVFVMVFPCALAMAAIGGRPELLTAGMLMLFSYFMASIGRRNHLHYKGLSQALLDLEASRGEGEALLRRWRSVVENAPEIILLVDRDLNVEFINHTEGPYLPADLVGKPLANFMPPDEINRVMGYLREVFESGQPTSYVTRAIGPDGEVSGTYSARVGPLSIKDSVESVVIIASNITERVRMEEELRHSQSQMRRLAARQEAALEDDRRRISREVHDELGQLLTVLKIDLGWMLQRLDEGPLYDRAQAMNQVVDATMANARTIARRLRPPILDELGPVQALDWLVEDICKRADLSYNLNTSLGGRILDADAALAVFRLCQEALTNVVRHARASHVDVELLLTEQGLRLRVQDNGRGISRDQVVGSLGLLGLQERVSLLGGQLTIQGKPDHGTEVLALIPLENAIRERSEGEI